MTQIRRSDPTCGAARPTPFSTSIVFAISKTNRWIFGLFSSSTLTSRVLRRKKSFGYLIILRVGFCIFLKFYCHPRESGDPEMNIYFKAAGFPIKSGMTKI
jgi:hypothetical protein